MARRALCGWGRWCLPTGILLAMVGAAHGAALDEKGEISLGVRTYTAARVGTQGTDIQICNLVDGKRVCGGSNGAGPNPTQNQVYRALTFPVSAAGHLRQSRFYVEAELDHDLSRLLQEGFGPFALLNDLPFKFQKFKYHLTYRGEYEGVYDYGPAEYSTAFQYFNQLLVPPFSGHTAPIGQSRKRLRSVATDRNRLFQAYSEMQVGKLLMRFGRQILAWGDTDAFRLLDNINPTDSSFGGFLVPLDERRVPLDMLRLNYEFGKIGPFYEVFLEGYAAIDEAVGFEPGVPAGSPWALPNLGAPSAVLNTVRTHPQRTIEDTRGGGRLVFNAPIPGIEEAQFTIAHYYTYLDTPEVQTYVTEQFPLGFTNGPGAPALALAVQSAPRVQITGASTNFAVPIDVARMLFLSGQPIIRSELAYFAGEPRQTQSQLDPFVYGVAGCQRANGGQRQTFPAGSFILPDGGTLCTGGRRYGDSWNYVLGIDSNQFIHWLNSNQSFFISTQFFYKHLLAAQKREQIPNQAKGVFNGEVLPVPIDNQVSRAAPRAGAAQSILIHQPIDQYLQTLLIATSYYSGQISPSFTLFYDWSGAFVVLPQVTFSRDPFRFSFSYSYLEANRLKGASGVSLLRDRDNVLFQFEYVI
jgi:hypothetical protein